MSGAAGLDPATLVERYGARLYALARRLMGNHADAEDVVQNALLKALQNADRFRGDSDPMGWLYRIALNEGREIFRQRRRRPAVSLDALPLDFDDGGHVRGEIAGFQEPGDPEEVERAVRVAIEELPDGYREAVVLVDLHGLGYAEAARLMDLGVPAFKTRLHRARLHLRNRLEELWARLAEPAPREEGAR